MRLAMAVLSPILRLIQSLPNKHSTHEADQHALAMRDWSDNEYHQIDRHCRFSGNIFDTTFGELISVTSETLEASSLEQIGISAPDKVLLLHVQSEKPVLLNGAFCDASIIHYSSAMPIHAVSEKPVHAYIITIDKQLFFDNMRGLETTNRFCLPFENFIEIGQNLHNDVTSRLEQILTMSQDSYFEDSRIFETLEDLLEILSVIFLSGHKSAPPKGLFSNQSYVIQKCCQYLHNKIYEEISVQDLCDYTRVSRRSLQSGFNSIFKINPKEYIKVVRLNRARQLIIRDPSIKIHNVALESGFNHFGRFSQYYQEFFGEPPSQTATRRRKEYELFSS